MSHLIKYYFVVSSLILHILVLLVFIKVAGSFASVFSFFVDVIDRFFG